MIFNKIKHIELPQQAQVGEGFAVTLITDGVVPFGQVIIRQHDNWQWIVRGNAIFYRNSFVSLSNTLRLALHILDCLTYNLSAAHMK